MNVLNEPWLEWVLFGVSLGSISIIFAFAAVSAVRRDFQFFPPPDGQSWQHRTFLLLFRLFLYPLAALTFIAFEPVAQSGIALHYGLGGLLFVCGFGMAVWLTLQMGWRNAFGEKHGLVTDGWFRFSRNPVYVATCIGLTGWCLIANAATVSLLLAAWGALYIFAPFVEEPWLEKVYGSSYREYKARTRRFL